MCLTMDSESDISILFNLMNRIADAGERTAKESKETRVSMERMGGDIKVIKEQLGHKVDDTELEKVKTEMSNSLQNNFVAHEVACSQKRIEGAVKKQNMSAAKKTGIFTAIISAIFAGAALILKTFIGG